MINYSIRFETKKDNSKQPKRKENSMREDLEIIQDPKVKLGNAAEQFLLDHGCVVNTKDGNTYLGLRAWFKKTDEDGVYVWTSHRDMPDDLKEGLRDFDE